MVNLSPQAKNYVTDKEYLRGWPNPDNLLDVDYWNGYKIWGEIKNNQDILNKWFSEMGQAHGLRNFTFTMSFIQMPFRDDPKGEAFNLIVGSLIKRNLITLTTKEDEYLAILPNGKLKSLLLSIFSLKCQTLKVIKSGGILLLVKEKHLFFT